MTQRIYPSTSIEILDGNLIDRVSVPDTAVLILDRAYKGPTERLYYVTDAKVAAHLFGERSPIVRSMLQVFQTGARDIVLYRLGGKAASLNNIFGLTTSISFTEASATADANYSLYIGPEPLNPAVDCVIVYDEKKRIVYSNANDGAINLNVVTVDGFSKTENEIYVGSHLNPVPFAKVKESLGKRTVKLGDQAVTDIDPAEADKMDPTSLVVKLNDKYLTADDYTFENNQVTIKPEKMNPATNSVEVAYVVKFTEEEVKEKEIVYVEGEDLMNATYKELYEAFDRALEGIPKIETIATYMGDLFDVPNIANGDEDEDRLEYVLINEDEDGELVYEWSDKKILYRKNITETTFDVNEADLTKNGQPIIAKQYSEVDFVHRAGMWALLTTSRGKYPNIVFGTRGPVAYTPKYIKQWLGKKPVYTFDGQIIQDGSGLLGHRLMVGNTKYAGGYFATVSGFPDGEVAQDSTGVDIDLGRYISIVPTRIQFGNEIVSGAAAYAGLIPSITPGNSTTNKYLPNVRLAVPIKEVKEKELQEVGYVTFRETVNRGTVVTSGNLASRLTSDFRYISTAIMLTRVAADIADLSDPYLGNGIDESSTAALHSAVDARLRSRQQQGYFRSFKFNVLQTGPNQLHIPIWIVPKEELREVTATIAVTRRLSEA